MVKGSGTRLYTESDAIASCVLDRVHVDPMVMADASTTSDDEPITITDLVMSKEYSSCSETPSESAPSQGRVSPVPSTREAQQSRGISTLVRHQQIRQQKRYMLAANGEHSTRASTPNRFKASKVFSDSYLSNCFDEAQTAASDAAKVSMNLGESYFLDGFFKQHTHSTSNPPPFPRAGMNADYATSTATKPNPAHCVSAIASQGEYIAVGDCAGHVFVMKRRPLLMSQRRVLLEEGERRESAWGGVASEPATSSSPRKVVAAAASHPHSSDTYMFHCRQQAYTPVLDPLNNVEVKPGVSALAFLPYASLSTYLLTSNIRTPKLYKIMSVHESSASFEAREKLDGEGYDPLTTASRVPIVAMKQVERYALQHESDIHSICPLAAGGEQFVTSDDQTIRLWCTDYPETSIECFNLSPSLDEESPDVLRCVRHFQHEPFLLFTATSGGAVHVLDTRHSLRWGSEASQRFVNPPRSDADLGHITNSLYDCALSPCGRYIAGRDAATTCLWDVRMVGGGSNTTRSADYKIVRSWVLKYQLYYFACMISRPKIRLEKFNIQFLNHTQVCTGGMGNALYVMDITKATPLQSKKGMELLYLPIMEKATDGQKGPLSATKKPGPWLGMPRDTLVGEDGVTKTNIREKDLSPVMLLSRPVMSPGGVCSMTACYGRAVIQLCYKS